jgi:hypothetical protein
VKKILAVLALIVAGALTAQAQINFNVTSTADAVHYRGAWTAGTTETALVDLKDSTADSSGYVNSLYLGGAFKLYSAAGFNSYLGTIEYEPTKALAAILKSTNISADYVRFTIHGDVGDTVPTVGNAYLTGGAGAEFDVAVNSSGSVVWEAVYAGWQNPGIFTVKSGLQVYLGGTSTTQSAKSAKIRRLLHLRTAKISE